MAQLENVRFFTTPAERHGLDSLRYGDATRKRAVMRKKPPVTPEPVEFRGIVTRPNAPDVVWLNDSNVLHDDLSAGGLRVRTNSDAAAEIETSDGGTVILLPGQSYDHVSGNVTGIRVWVNQ